VVVPERWDYQFGQLLIIQEEAMMSHHQRRLVARRSIENEIAECGLVRTEVHIESEHERGNSMPPHYGRCELKKQIRPGVIDQPYEAVVS
jgi:hypothetical protein